MSPCAVNLCPNTFFFFTLWYIITTSWWMWLSSAFLFWMRERRVAMGFTHGPPEHWCCRPLVPPCAWASFKRVTPLHFLTVGQSATPAFSIFPKVQAIVFFWSPTTIPCGDSNQSVTVGFQLLPIHQDIPSKNLQLNTVRGTHEG